MYDWEYDVIEFVRKLKAILDGLKKELNSYPDGFITIAKKNSGNKTEYYHRIYSNGKYQQKYLSAITDRKLIDALLLKKEQFKKVKKELRQTQRSFNIFCPVAIKILSEIRIDKKSYPPSFSENPKHPDYLRYKTVRGEIVRSISERTIADALFRYNLDYKYEKALQLGNAIIYPDFTIINPINKKTYYLEFLGLNNEEYNKAWDFKLARFAESNIIKENYLITIYPDDLNNLDHIIKQLFTLERYNCILK